MNETKELNHFLEAYPEHKKALRFHKVVCPCCRGTGSTYLGWHADEQPSFSHEELWEDPDFGEAYITRQYDGPCPECGGNNVVEEIDELSSSKEAVEEWHGWLQDAYEDAAVRASERRMGA